VQAARVDYRAAAEKILATIAGAAISELSLGDSNGTTVWQALPGTPTSWNTRSRSTRYPET
jgi:hypothetical protein